MAREPYQVGNFKGHVANSDHTLHEMIHGARNGFYRVIKEKYGADPIDVRTIIDDFYKKLHTVQQPPNPPMGPPHAPGSHNNTCSGFKEGKKLSEILDEEDPLNSF